MNKGYWLILAAMTIGACSPNVQPANVSAVDPTPTATATSEVLIDAKAMYAAEALYNVPANAYVTLAVKNQIDDKTKAYAKAELITAYSALKIAREAYAVNNAVGFNSAVALLKSIKDNLAAKGVK